MAKRYGQFTLLEDLGRSMSAERFRAMHDSLGGPFYVKRYSHLEQAFFPELNQRCERLMTISHPSLTPHLGHGEIEGVPFAVAPWCEGLDLTELMASLRDRRVTLGLDAMLYILRSVSLAVDALQGGEAGDGLTHGDVTAGHIRIGPEGEVWLTGAPTPRGLRPGQPAEPIWDGAGVCATVYDLIGLTRPGPARPSLPTVLDRLVRRGLGIGSASDHLSAREIAEGFDDVADSLKVRIDQEALRPLAQRTLKAIGRRSSRRGGADALPTLEPIGSSAPPARQNQVPASIDLEPVDDEGPAVEARTEALPGRPPAPEPAPPPDASDAGLPRINTQPIPKSELPGPPFDEVTDQLPPPPVAETPREITAITKAPSASGSDDGDLGPTQEGGFDEFMQEETTPEVEVPAGHDGPGAEPAPASPSPDAAAGPAAPSSKSLPPDIPLEDEEAPARPQRVPSGELQGLGASLLTDPSDGPSLVDPMGPVDDPTREVPIGRRESATASLDGDPFATDETTEPPGAEADAASGKQDEGRAGLQAVSALLRLHRITEADLEQALAQQDARGGRLVEILINDGAIKDNAVADALAEEMVKPRLSDAGLMRFLPDNELLRRLPQTYAVDRRLLPLARRPTGQLVVAVADPYDERSLVEVGQIYGAEEVEMHVAALGALKRAIAEAYRPAAGTHASDEHTVLLCVADREQAGALGARFVEEGFSIEHAADGQMAKSLLDRHLPDAVLAAADLSGHSGTELLISARAAERHVDTPFFIFGPEDEALEAKVLDLGGDDYFDTPLNLNVVIKKLRRALRKRPPRPAPPQVALPDGPTTKNVPAGSTLESPGLPFEFEDAHPPAGADFGANLEEEPPAEPTGVMGTLRQMAVSEIVQSLELGRKTARVDLVPTDGEKGSFSFVNGQVVYAECGELAGEQAFFSLARHQEGFFRIHYGDVTDQQNIEKPTTFLLLEAMRRIDEETNAA